jgi:nucleotide-binding universal stress UspA family protein
MVTMYDHILVPTSGVEEPTPAAERAIDLAERSGATIHALYVLESGRIPIQDGSQWVLDDLAGVGEVALERVEKRARAAGVGTVETVEREGAPHREILSYVEEAGIDLLVMGTHGRKGLDRYLLGSVTEKVVRASPVPVLSVKRKGASQPPIEYSDVLIPTDGSEGAEAAVDHGIAFAETVGADVHGLSVTDVRATVPNVDVGSQTEVHDLLEAEGERATDYVDTQGSEAGLDVTTAVVRGTPYAQIREYVAEHDVDLIAMGTHGRTGLERYLLGSVAEKVVRTADVPVLTVRLGDGDRDGDDENGQ